MATFGDYSRYYDLFYGDKDYAEEAKFVDGLVREFARDKATILEIGSGTGKHAHELVLLGHSVHGIDVSETMLERAASLVADLPPQEAAGLRFEHGDARTYRAGRTFDAVMSLFHVMSYQTSNDDLRKAFTTAAEHLESGGTFLFDCWYGPTVLTDRPVRREKLLEDDDVHVTRIARPVMLPNENVCEVNYDVTVVSKLDGTVSTLTETHRVRYLFAPEVELLLDLCGFDLVRTCEFQTGGPLGFSTWNGCFVARKR